jgi:iron uptake system component EfeO
MAGACSSSSSSGPETAVTASDAECRVAATALAVGANTLVVTNKGNKVTEIYVYGAGDKIITEREDIGPGTTVKVNVSLAPGQYEVACKPGQTGNGIRQPITVAAPTTTAKP